MSTLVAFATQILFPFFIFSNFCSSVSHQYLRLDEIVRQPQDQAQSLVQNQPSLLVLPSPHFLLSLFCLLPAGNQIPNIVSAPKLQNSIRGTFLLNSWMDLSFQAPRKWIKPISHSSAWYNAVDSPFHLCSDDHFLITLWSSLCRWNVSQIRSICTSYLPPSFVFLSSRVIHAKVVVKECWFLISELRLTSILA